MGSHRGALSSAEARKGPRAHLPSTQGRLQVTGGGDVLLNTVKDTQCSTGGSAGPAGLSAWLEGGVSSRDGAAHRAECAVRE